MILDEIHERNLNEDFVMIILRRLMNTYPKLKLILMSATLSAEDFSNYFDKFSIKNGRVSVPGRTFPVTGASVMCCVIMYRVFHGRHIVNNWLSDTQTFQW